MRNFAPQAQADLDQVIGWLLDRGTAAATAERVLTAVLEAAELLARRPQIGRSQPTLLPDPFRFWSIPRHNLPLVYNGAITPPTILRILSTNRDLIPIFTELSTLNEPGPE